MYTVVVDGKAEEFTGGDAFFNALRHQNAADKGADGIAQHDTQLINPDGIILCETFKGQRVGNT
jgi:hypothetical protein